MKKILALLLFASFPLAAQISFGAGNAKRLQGLQIKSPLTCAADGYILTWVLANQDFECLINSGGTGIASLNGLTGGTQTFATGTTGTDFTIVSSGTAHTFNFPSASASNRGLLLSADWTTFNGKASTANPLSQFASTTSAQLAGVISNGTGTGALVFGTAPTITLANGTALPLATGITGFGSGVATLLATFSSANLLAALTTKTGTGSAVFGTSPTIATPNVSGLDLTDITGSTQCLHANSSGVVTGTGSDCGSGGGVTSVTGTAPVASSGGATPAISCPTCIVATVNPGVGILHVAGSTQTATSSAVSLTADVSGTLPAGNLPTATGAAKGIVQGDASTITISSGVESCTTATTGQLGCVKPDGSTITISSGVISAASAGNGNAGAGVTTTFSATPTFTCPSSSAGTEVSFILSTALSANVTSSTLASCTNYSQLNFRFTQAASTTAYTVAMPTGFSAACQVSPIYSSNTNMSFIWDGTTARLIACSVDAGPAVGLEIAAPSQTPASGAPFSWNDSTSHFWRMENSSGIYYQASKELTSGNPRCAGGANTADAVCTSAQLLAVQALTSAHIYVGNGSNIPTDVAVSGDISLTNAGVATVTQIEAAAIPVSAHIAGTNSSKQLVASTAANLSAINYVAGSGSANAQTATYSPAVAALTDGLSLCWLPTAANTTTTPTFAPNGLTAHTIVKAGTAALAASDLTTTWPACATYNLTATQWDLQNPQTTGSGVTSVTGTAPVVSSGGSTPAISCPTCIVATVNPGVGILHVAGSTQTATSSAVSLTADVSGVLPTANIAVALANQTSINGLGITGSTGTLTIANGKTATVNNSLTLAGTDTTTMTFPTTSATIARTDAANTFTGHQTIEGVTSTGATGTGNLVFASSPTLVTPTLGTPASATLTNATGLPINGVVSATGAIATIADGNNPLVVNCALTSGTTCLTTGETTAATTAGAVEHQITTLTTTTAIPLQLTQGAAGPANAAAPNVINVSAAAAGGASGASNAGSTGAGIGLLTGNGSAGGATTGNGGAGGAFIITEGNGGAGGGTTTNNGGNGGGVAWTTGNGGNAATTGTSGNGGNVVLTTGVGGTTGTTVGSNGIVQITSTAPASAAANGIAVGALFQVTGTTGGATSSTGVNTGGVGSAPTIAGGNGGAATGAGGNTTVGGAGGSVTLTGGTGGAGSAGNNSGGAGGNINLTPGAGGAKTGTGTAGATGIVQVTGTLNASTAVSTGTAPSCTAGTGGVICLGEGTNSTAASAVDQLVANSTLHDFAVLVNGGVAKLVASTIGYNSGSISASVGSTNIASSANFPTGQYHLDCDVVVTAVGSTPTLATTIGWTDISGTARTKTCTTGTVTVSDNPVSTTITSNGSAAITITQTLAVSTATWQTTIALTRLQ